MNAALTAKAPAKAKSRRLRDEFADWMRLKNYSPNTIRDYVADVVDFVVFSGKRDPRTMGAAEVQAFLTMLAVKRTVEELLTLSPDADLAECDRLVAACFASEDYIEGRFG